MPTKPFEFSPRVALVLEHLATLRNVSRVCEEEGAADIKRLLKYFKDKLRESIPGSTKWEAEIEDNTLYIWPGQVWDVVQGDGLGIGIDFSCGVTPRLTDCDPWVGIYVPDNWANREKFNEKLREAIPKDLLEEFDGEPEPRWPVWVNVKYLDYAVKPSFDLQGFLQEIERRTLQLVGVKTVIDNTIRQLGRA